MIEGTCNAKIHILLNNRFSNGLQGTDNQGLEEQWRRGISATVKDELNKIPNPETRSVLIKHSRAALNTAIQKGAIGGIVKGNRIRIGYGGQL
jgi:type III secretory pathway lipoprotein EscJ